jgi:hypothetical protein
MTPMLGSCLMRSAESQRMLSPDAFGHRNPRLLHAADFPYRSHSRILDDKAGSVAGVVERVAITYAERIMGLLPYRSMIDGPVAADDLIPAEPAFGCQDPAATLLSSGRR